MLGENERRWLSIEQVLLVRREGRGWTRAGRILQASTNTHCKTLFSTASAIHNDNSNFFGVQFILCCTALQFCLVPVDWKTLKNTLK